MKTCNKCGETKPLFEFHKRKGVKDGHKGRCKACCKEYAAAWYQANKERVKEYSASYYQANRDRRNKAMIAHYQANKERYKEMHAAWREANKERYKEINAAWYAANKERHKETTEAWRKKNKGAVNATAAKRRAAKKQATPAWADLEEIKQIYNKAAEMNKYCIELGTDIRYHVDHVIPLQNDKVSGLHVPENLQIITSEENLRKNNNFEVN